MKAHKLTLMITALLFSAAGLSAQENLKVRKGDGYRGIWYELGQVNNEYGDKYSGGLGTYTVKHIPMAIHSQKAKWSKNSKRS